MLRLPHGSTQSDTLLPYTTLVLAHAAIGQVGRVDVRKVIGRQPLEARDVGSLRIEAVAHPPRCQAVGEALTAAKGCGGIEMLAGKLSHFCANVIRPGDAPAFRPRIGGGAAEREVCGKRGSQYVNIWGGRPIK